MGSKLNKPGTVFRAWACFVIWDENPILGFTYANGSAAINFELIKRIPVACASICRMHPYIPCI